MTVNRRLTTYKAPCMNCPMRTSECHGTCCKYKVYKNKVARKCSHGTT